MPSGPPAIFPFPRPLDELQLYKRGVQAGFDGSLLDDNMLVYVVPRYRVPRYPYSIEKAIRSIDYFHGRAPHGPFIGMPICQVYPNKEDFPAVAFVGPSGFVGKCVIHIQRRWRRWRREGPLRAKRYNVQMVKFGMLLAVAWCRVSSRLDEIDPS